MADFKKRMAAILSDIETLKRDIKAEIDNFEPEDEADSEGSPYEDSSVELENAHENLAEAYNDLPDDE